MHEERTGQHLVVDGEVADALAVAWRARDAIGLDPNVAALIQDRLRRVAQGPVLALSDDPAEPDQLVRRGLQRRRRGHRRSLVPAPRPARAAAGLRALDPPARAGHRGHARPGHALPLPPRRRAAIEAEHRVGRVREHRGVDEPLLRRGRRPRDGAAAARGRGAAAAVDDARAGRLLDARRLPELGHRLRLRPLAPDEEARARPAGADRDRRRRPAVAVAQRGRVGEVHPRGRLRAVRAQAARADRRGAGPVLSVPRRTRSRRRRRSSSASRLVANAARAVSAGIPDATGGRAAAAVRVRPGRRPARDHDARATTPRSRRSRRARTRTAGSTSRGSTTTARRSPRRSARARPRASACWCATAAGTRAS